MTMHYLMSEIRDGEVFIGNTGKPDIETWKARVRGLADLKTARLGQKALSIDGASLESKYRPIFIQNHELAKYNAAMEAELSRIRGGGK